MSARAGLSARRLTATVTLSLFISLFSVAAASAARPDFDGDGRTGAADCAPLDRAVFVGAPDKPDLAFEDTNCDGIDGDRAKAIFVTPTAANNNGTGSVTSPKQTLNGTTPGSLGAIAEAKAAGKDVYMAGGTYNETVQLEDNVSLFGGYEPLTGERTGALTTVKGAPAIFANGDSGVVLQLLTLEGQRDGAGNAYGLRAIKDGAAASRLVLSRVTTQAIPGAPAANNGSFQGNGFFGGGSSGGPGGVRNCADGLGGLGTSGSGVGGLGGGRGGIFGNTGAPGGTGSTGTTAANNAFTTVDQSTWQRPFAGTGGSGGPGGGGGGGRGGAGVTIFLFDDACGGNGGAGGTGGGGGFGGTGGQSGAGSFGAYLFDSSIAAIGSKFVGAAGGPGGNGANGGGGGGGTGPGATNIGLTCVIGICGTNGFGGGSGGTGGVAGGGGGGAGGPSAGVYQAGAGSGYAPKSGTTQQAGAAGLGGLRGNGGARAASGQSAPILRSGTAPATSTADFDGDGINDTADACPDAARGAGGNANGCPARAAKLADGDNDGVPNDGRDKCPTVAASESNDPDNDGCPPVVVTPPPTGGGGGGGSTGGGSTGGGGGGVSLSVTSATLTNRWLAFPAFTRARKLTVNNVPAGATVRVTCKTKKKGQQRRGCPYRSRSVTTTFPRAALNLVKPFSKRKLPVGTKITVTVSGSSFIGKVFNLTVRRRAVPSVRTLCMPPGGRAAACV